MKTSNPYLFFNDKQCKPAMEFYQKTFSGELSLMQANHAGSILPSGTDVDLVMHALLKTPAFNLMASDNFSSDTTNGDNVCIYIDCTSVAEVDHLYQALSKGGEEVMKPEETFWGAYFGSLTDVFGVSWMLNYTHTSV